MKKRFLILTTAMVLALALAGCGKEKDEEKKEETKQEESSDGETASAGELDYQFAEPAKGDTVAEIVVKDFGTIKVRFFEKEAPKAVENFVTHAKDGYYDGLTFHRVIDGFMLQGGDPNGNGTGGESIWGEPFEDEYDSKLYPWRGALCMANSGANTNGSQFFIVQNKEYDEELAKEMEQYQWPKEVIDTYKEKGGAPWLYQQHTVFGQVLEGMDVVDAIAAGETDSSDKPVQDVVIEKINVTEF